MPAATDLSARKLAKGRISALLDGADVRYVAIDGIEVVRRVYVTVRDADWDIPPIISLETELEETGGAIVVRAVAEQRSATAAVAWQATATLRADGSLSYSVVVSPREAFAFSRIGVCVLHPPATCAGRAYRAVAGAAQTDGLLPQLIAPQLVEGPDIFPLFDAFSELEIDVRGLGTCRFVFEGELFEMEDQRNWSDSSFKTYCTPLSVPRPQQARLDENIEQAVQVNPPATRPRSGRAPHGPVELRVGEPLACAVPEIGLGLGEPLNEEAGRAIRALAPEHLRVDLRHPDRFEAVLAQASDDAVLAGCPVVLALHLGDDPGEELAALEDHLRQTQLRVLRVLALSRDDPTSTGPLVQRARRLLTALLPQAAFAGGTDVWFVDLNRGRPDPDAMDAVAWSVTPEVHGYDELTMIEALEAQTDQALTARSFSGTLELLPGPITLRPRYNPNAADASQQALDHPPSSIDPRQGSMFAAAWTAGSIRAQALGGVCAATYFETAGPRGVIPSDGSDVFPCWHVIAWARRCAAWDVLATTSSAPLDACALLVRDPGGGDVEGLVVNLTPARHRVRLGELDPRSLRLESLLAASSKEMAVPVRDRVVEIELDPWDVVRLHYT